MHFLLPKKVVEFKLRLIFDLGGPHQMDTLRACNGCYNEF